MTTVGHLALLGVATILLGASGLRWSCRLTDGLAARILSAVAFAAGLAVAESLLLGLIAQGSNPLVLTGAAAVTWLLFRQLAPASPTLVRDQVAAAVTTASTLSHAMIGAAVVFVGGISAYQLWHPTYGLDGLAYHAAQPAFWVTNGRPGSLHSTIAAFPTQAYPKTMEVLVGWAYSIGRTPLAGVPITIGLSVLAATAVTIGLRKAGVSLPVAAVAAAAGLLIPWNLLEISGVFSDVPALAWLACALTLCSFAGEEPGAMGGAAVAAALAVGTKPTTLPLAAIGLAYVVWRQRQWVRSHAARWVGPGGLALALGSVWYIRDWATFGSPLWPFSQFPAGRPLPPIFRLYGTRFIDHPITTMRETGFKGYRLGFGGGLVLLAAVLLVVAASLLPAARPWRRTAIIGGALVVFDALLWADSKFTGAAPAFVPNGFVSLRYLTPAPLLAAVVLALVARHRGAVRPFAIVALIGALAFDLYEIRLSRFGYPFRPGVAICIAIAVIGAMAGMLVGQTNGVRRLVRQPWLAGVVTLGLIVAIAFPASRYLNHYIKVAQTHGNYDDAEILSYLRTQPGWLDGHAPVAAGTIASASFAGPHFTHPVSLITADTPCPQVRADARAGWVIAPALDDTAALQGQLVKSVGDCFSGILPAAVLSKDLRIYAPSRLVRATSSSTPAR